MIGLGLAQGQRPEQISLKFPGLPFKARPCDYHAFRSDDNPYSYNAEFGLY